MASLRWLASMYVVGTTRKKYWKIVNAEISAKSYVHRASPAVPIHDIASTHAPPFARMSSPAVG